MFAHVPPVLIPFIAITLPVAMPPPTGVTATVGSCHDVTLQWTQPSEFNDITTSVNCTPPSPGCTACTTSPCNITGLNASTEYNFTVTLNNQKCGTNSSTFPGRTGGEIECGVCAGIADTCSSSQVRSLIFFHIFRGHLIHYSATLGHRMVLFSC